MPVSYFACVKRADVWMCSACHAWPLTYDGVKYLYVVCSRLHAFWGSICLAWNVLQAEVLYCKCMSGSHRQRSRIRLLPAATLGVCFNDNTVMVRDHVTKEQSSGWRCRRFFCEGKPHELEWIISGFLTPWQRQNNWSCCHRIHSAEDVRNQTAVWVIATSATFSFRWRAQRSRPVRRHYRMLLWHISIDAFDFKLKLSVRWSIMALHFRQSCSVMHCLPRSGPSRQRRLQEETLFIPL